MFADKMKAFDNVKQIFIEVMEKNIAFLQSSPVDLFDVVKEYINTIRKIDTIEIEKVKTVLQLQNLLEDMPNRKICLLECSMLSVIWESPSMF